MLTGAAETARWLVYLPSSEATAQEVAGFFEQAFRHNTRYHCVAQYAWLSMGSGALGTKHWARILWCRVRA